jgi:hypothetical protein
VAGYIYSVYRGWDESPYEVRRVAIDKETPRRIITKVHSLAFGYAKAQDPGKVHRSPQAARDAFKAELLEQRGRLVERLARIDQILPTVDAIPEASEEDQ